MSIDTQAYAALADDSYKNRTEALASNGWIDISGIDYKVIAIASNPRTDYQGTAYLREGSSEVIISHRGTASIKDGMTDAGMVFIGHNNQLDDAMAFTERAISVAKTDAKKNNTPLNISITGHSLGGTLAEITAAKYGLHAETFNAFGPAGLTDLGKYGVDVNGQYPGIVNHVRATDVVGAGGVHLGTVRTYATPQDIETLRHAGYMGRAVLPANPLLAADINAHTITNFLPDNKVLGKSILSPENERLAAQNADPIDHYRRDVKQGGIDLATVANSRLPMVQSGRLIGQVADATAVIVVDQHLQVIRVSASVIGRAVDQTGHAISGKAMEIGSVIVGGHAALMSRLGLDQLGHPGHQLFKQAQEGIHKIDAQHGRTPDQSSNNAAACLALEAHRSGFKRIDDVDIGTDKKNFWAAQGPLGTAQMKVVGVSILESLEMPISQSTRNWDHAQQLAQPQLAQAAQHAQQLQNVQVHPQQVAAPAPGR